MGILLTIIACTLLFIFTIPAIVVGTVVSLFKHQGDTYFKSIAIGLDHLGNVICQHLFNITLIEKDGYKFGNIKESVSGVLGKNFEANTCTLVGLYVCKILDTIQKKHVENSIDNKI
jgi:hypothetical protein